MYLQLGDIIKILSPQLPQYHLFIFIISFVSSSHLQIRNISTNELFQFTISNNILDEPNIQQFFLIKRHEHPGFILQNNLTLNSWIDIYFTSNIPFILTCKISNIEEDMIELSLYDSSNTIEGIFYIDFAYQGIPLDLSIDKIIIRDTPTFFLAADDHILNNEQNTTNLLTEKIINIDSIFIHSDLDAIEVTEIKNFNHRRFSLNTQLNDLTEELLVGHTSLSKFQIQNISLVLERYKQLYQQNISDIKHHPFFYNFLNYTWILPVIINKPTLFDLDESLHDDTAFHVEKYKKNLDDLIEKINISYTTSCDNPYYSYLNAIIFFYKLSNSQPQSSNSHNISIDNLQSISSNGITNLDQIDSFLLSTTSLGKTIINKNFDFVVSNIHEASNIKSTIFLSLAHSLFNSYKLSSTLLINKALLNSKCLYDFKFMEKTPYSTSIIDDTTPGSFEHFLKENIHFENDIKQSSPFDLYLNKITPNITNLIQHILPHTKINKLSLYSVLQELSKLSITSRDIKYGHLLFIDKYIQNAIIELKRHIIHQRSSSSNISITKYENSFPKNLAKYIELYHLHDPISLSTSECISRMLIYDNMNLFNTSLLLDLSDIVDHSQLSSMATKFLKFDNDNRFKLTSNKCNKYVLSKQYHSMVQLTSDDNRDIFFDQEFDTTRYNLLDPSIQDDQTASIDILISKYKFNKADALDEYNAIINKKKLVKPGHFASVYNDGNIKFFIRNEKNSWESTSQFDGLTGTDIFCNIQKSCFKLNTNICSTKPNIEKENKINILHDSLNEFDKKYILTKEVFKENIIKKHEAYKQLLFSYKLRANQVNHPSNTVLYNLGSSYIPEDVTFSPYYEITQAILAINDLPTKFTCIIKLCSKFTRESNYMNIDENPYWRYCLHTNAKLLPSFLYSLALVFLNNNENYLATINNISRKQGVLSDDGDKIIDIHSGYVIKYIDYDDNTMDYSPLNQSILEQLSQTQNMMDRFVTTFSMPPKKIAYIVNVIDSITKHMYISLNLQSKEFIIKHVVDDFNKTLLNTKLEGNKLIAIESFYIIYFTLAYLLIEITTSIPSFIPKKQFPGCVKAFDGWPVDDKSNNNALIYLSCVSFNISTKQTLPWKALKTPQLHNGKIGIEAVSNKLDSIIDKYVLSKPIIRNKINHKISYLDKMKNFKKINEEYSILKWVGFLPPQHSFKKNFSITNKFDGLSNQQFYIKSMYYTLSVFHYIQKYIHDNSIKHTDVTIDPFIEKITNLYNITDTITLKNTDVLKDIRFLFTLSQIINDYKKKHAIHHICTHKVFNIHIPQALKHIAKRKKIMDSYVFNLLKNTSRITELSAFIPNLPNKLIFIHDDPSTTFEKLGINITPSIFHNIYQHVNKQHFHLYDTHNNVNNHFILFDFLKSTTLDYYANDDIQKTFTIFQTILMNYIDTGEVSIKSTTSFKNILFEKITLFKIDITEFIHEHSSMKITNKNKLNKFINELCDSSLDMTSFWKPLRESSYDNNIFDSIENETILRGCNYLKSIGNMLFLSLPTSIVNNVQYTNVNIPPHWELSVVHNDDLSNFYKKYYSFMKKYDECQEQISKITTELKPLRDYILKIMNLLSPLNNTSFDHDFIYIFLQYLLFLYLHQFLQYKSYDDEILTTCLADFIYDVFNLFGPENNFKFINYSYDSIYSNVNRIKEHEKNTITDMLQEMSKEQRQVDNEFKKYSIGFWSKGQEKGLREYQKTKYDEDREVEYNDKSQFMFNLHADIFKDYNEEHLEDSEAFDMEHIFDDDDAPEDFDGE